MPELTADQIREFLMAGTRTLKLATVRRDGRPHVAPVWFLVDGETIVFTTGSKTVKGANLRRDPRVFLCVDDESPPCGFVLIDGAASLSEEPQALLHWATRIAARYVGEEQAVAFGRRNAVPGELLVRVTPTKIISELDVIGPGGLAHIL